MEKTPSQRRRAQRNSEIADDYLNEKSITEIMEKHGCGRQTVYSALEYESVSLRGQTKKPKRGSIKQQLIDALAPFVAAYEKARDPIGDSDLYDEQTQHVTVTLGDCRHASAVLWNFNLTRSERRWKR